MSKQDQQQKVAEKDITGAAALNFSDADRSKNVNRIVSEGSHFYHFRSILICAVRF